MEVTSEVLLSVTKTGLGRPAGLYFPSLRVSLMEKGCIELSISVKMAVTLVKSEWSRSNFLVPLAHSARPSSTILKFLAELASVLAVL